MKALDRVTLSVDPQRDVEPPKRPTDHGAWRRGGGSRSRPCFTRRNPKREAREGRGRRAGREGRPTRRISRDNEFTVECIEMLTAYTVVESTSLSNSVGGSIRAANRRSRIARFLKNEYAVNI